MASWYLPKKTCGRCRNVKLRRQALGEMGARDGPPFKVWKRTYFLAATAWSVAGSTFTAMGLGSCVLIRAEREGAGLKTSLFRPARFTEPCRATSSWWTRRLRAAMDDAPARSPVSLLGEILRLWASFTTRFRR